MKERSLLDFWCILYVKRYWIVFIALLTSFVCIGMSLIIPPVYEARALFYFPEVPIQQSFLSPDAVKGYARNPLIPPLVKESSVPYIGFLKSAAIAENVYQEFPQKSIRKLMWSDIDVDVSDENMLRLFSRDRDPQVAADVANAYIRIANEMLLNTYKKNLRTDRNQLVEEVATMQKRLSQANAFLRTMEEEQQVPNLDSEIQRLSSFLTNSKNVLDENEVALLRIAKNIEEVDGILIREQAAIFEDASIVDAPVITELKQDLVDVLLERQAMELELGSANIELQLVEAKQESIVRQLQLEAENIASAQAFPQGTFAEEQRRRKLDLMVQAEVIRAGNLARLQSNALVLQKIFELNKKKELYGEKKLDVTELEKHVEVLGASLMELDIQLNRDAGFVVVIDEATPPTGRSYPIIWMNAVMGLVVGLLAGIMFSLFFAYIKESDKIKTLQLLKVITQEPKSLAKQKKGGKA